MKMPVFKPMDCIAGKHKAREGESEIVKALALHGVKNRDIAKYIGMRERSFDEKYGDILEEVRVIARSKVHEFLYRSATGEALMDDETKATYADCLRAAIFYAKTQMGWVETMEHKHTGEIGINSLTDDQLINLIENGGQVLEREE